MRLKVLFIAFKSYYAKLKKGKSCQRLTPERKKTLDSKIDELNIKYRRNGTFDYDALCADMDIRYYEHVNVIQPTTLPRQEERRDWSKAPKMDVFNFPFIIHFVREYIKAHEFAHVIFEHSRDTPGREAEAAYFARKLTDIKLPSFLINKIGVIEVIFRNEPTIHYYRNIDDSSGRLYHKYLRKLIETIQPIHPSNR